MTITRSTDQMPREIEHMSYSQLQTLSQCGMKYLIEKGYGEHGEPNWASVGGSAVHATTEVWDREYAFQDKDFDLYAIWAEQFEIAILNEEARNGVDRADFRPTGRKSVKWPNKQDKSWWDENGPILVNNWIGWRHASPWDIVEFSGELAIEVGLNTIIGEVQSQGSIDRVFITPNKDLVIVDIKTGAEPAGYLQLGTYNVGLRNAWRLTEDTAIFGAFWMAKENELTTPLDLRYLNKEYLDQVYWRANEIRKQGLFLPVVDKHCGWCSVKKFCPAFGGKLPTSVVRATIPETETDEEGD